jgi:hypothetical protein
MKLGVSENCARNLNILFYIFDRKRKAFSGNIEQQTSLIDHPPKNRYDIRLCNTNDGYSFDLCMFPKQKAQFRRKAKNFRNTKLYFICLFVPLKWKI